MLINLYGAFNGYDRHSMGPTDTYWPTIAGGPQFHFNGSNWSNVGNGDGSGNLILATSTITTDTTWDGTSVHVVSGIIPINSGVTLTLEPGTIVKFDTSTTSGFTINGTLDSEGQDEHFGNKIFFTSLNDDLLGGDSNANGSSTVASAGDWGGITINPGGRAIFGQTVIRYGGSTTPMFYNHGGYLSIATSSTVAYGNTYGIKTDSGTTTVDNSDIGFNEYGLYLNGGTINVTSTSTIHDNSLYGAFNNTSATSSFSAQNNYWGTSTEATTTGPYNPGQNPSGTGDRVSDYIDFDPWLGKTGSSGFPHYIIDPNCHSDGYCGSVPNGSTLLLLDSSTTPYVLETSAAASTWNALANVTITAPTSTIANVAVYATTNSDVAWKGMWDPIFPQPNPLYLNTYYLDLRSSSEIQNTITHELGHALGLDHSYTSNVMYFLQSSQISLGSQDKSDYYYLWP